MTFRGCYLVEIYRDCDKTEEFSAAKLCVPGIFVAADEIGTEWAVLGHVPVDPITIQFPEFLAGQNHAAGSVVFECGEIRLPLPYRSEDIDQIEVRKRLFFGVGLPILSLLFLDRKDLIRQGELSPGYGLANVDLRYSPFRAEVYGYLPIMSHEPYYEKQTRLGLNLDRLLV